MKERFLRKMKTTASKRVVETISVHCTGIPDHKMFDGTNHHQLQENMRAYHMNVQKWKDIGQHFTVFPDGVVLAGRDLEQTPAVIAGHNTGDIGVEVVGWFDKGKDKIEPLQLLGLLFLLKELTLNNNISPSSIRYHHWFNPAKSCPGNDFLGAGNTKQAFQESLLPLVRAFNNLETNYL